ncbi:PREDICTED: protein phosphatase 2C 3 [Brassica oleracea var. oleracea]|uniref:protein-serine/threonine phosphatase n=1 Tax=Brassica oleracea var. oleracea TaxID=109376 RepID=A0A0D3C8A3_BRAOL|nr:PREDICTED: protein phosphatase 2C 3 [Brassica oleracea var. oleracea]
MTDICYEDEASWSSRRRRIGVHRCRISPSEMHQTAAAAVEDKEVVHNRNKQENDIMNCASPPSQSSPDSEAGESVLLDVEVTRDDVDAGVIAVIPSKKTVRETDPRPRYGAASVCGRRRDMEDAVAIHPSFVRKQTEFSREKWHYFGVYDGHGCSHVATRCKERLHEIVQEEALSEKKEEWRKMMERSFTRMDNEVVSWGQTVMSANCRCELQTPDCDAVGSTAVVSVVTPEKIIVANCGDSRAVLCRNGKPVPLSTDHKPDRPDELDRIQKAGGRVIYWDGPRVLGVLAMSRAIGDNYLKPYVSSEPEVTVTDRTEEDEFLILASDGLWDVVTNEVACAMVHMYLSKRGGRGRRRETPECVEGKDEEEKVVPVVGSKKSGKKGEIADKACTEASVLLTKLALAKHGSDNVSVVVVDLRRRKNNRHLVGH